MTTEREQPDIDPVTGRRPGEVYFDERLGHLVSVPMHRNQRGRPKRARTIDRSGKRRGPS
jgi:hypothetical protein